MFLRSDLVSALVHGSHRAEKYKQRQVQMNRLNERPVRNIIQFMADFHADGKRLWDTLHQLAEIGGTEAGGVARVALTDADRAGRDQFVEWVTDVGCSIHIDRMGNLFARREGTDPNRDPVAVSYTHLTLPTKA